MVAMEKIVLGDFASKMEEIESSSVSLVFTDPPYSPKYFYIWEKLARESKRILVDGGSLVSLTGNINLPSVLSTVGRYLDYYWCCALLHAQVSIVEAVNIYNTWKPVIWFSKGKPIRSNTTLPDGISPHGAQKNDHRWQQADSWAEHFIPNLVPPGGTVLDPFLGSGTTAVVCRKLGLSFIGIDNDPKAISTTLRRLNGV